MTTTAQTTARLKLRDIKPGDRLVADAGFSCLRAGESYAVRSADNASGLFINCDHGRHYLDGQRNDAGEIVGLSRAAS